MFCLFTVLFKVYFSLNVQYSVYLLTLFEVEDFFFIYNTSFNDIIYIIIYVSYLFVNTLYNF